MSSNEVGPNDSTGDIVDDPFSPEHYNIIQFTQLSRIYDVLMTLVQLENPDAAERLLNAHAGGSLVNPSPQYTGDFIFDRLNSVESAPEG